MPSKYSNNIMKNYQYSVYSTLTKKLGFMEVMKHWMLG